MKPLPFLIFLFLWLDLITNLIITQQQNKKKWNEFSLSSGILSLRNTWRLHLCKAKQYAVLFIAVKKRERHWMQTDICTPLWIYQLSCRAWKKWIHCYWSTRAKWAMLKRQYFFPFFLWKQTLVCFMLHLKNLISGIFSPFFFLLFSDIPESWWGADEQWKVSIAWKWISHPFYTFVCSLI